jgi:hypothetical protein
VNAILKGTRRRVEAATVAWESPQNGGGVETSGGGSPRPRNLIRVRRCSNQATSEPMQQTLNFPTTRRPSPLACSQTTCEESVRHGDRETR